MAARSGLIRLAVFGHPVSQSLSPAIHRGFAAQFGLDIDYRAIDATAATFHDRVCELADAGGLGCNITVPLKRLAWKAAARCSPIAERAEAANTLVFESRSVWFADNTDGRGLVRDLQRHRPDGPRGRRILLIGAGGAAAGIIGDLLQSGAAEVHIANRTPGNAHTLARRHARLGPLSAGGLDDLESLRGFDLVIQATSAGHGGAIVDLPAGLFAPGGLCYDLNYGPAAQTMRRFCADRGIDFRDGLGMLVEQAGLAFELWTGRAPDCEPVLHDLQSTAANA